MSLLVTLNIFHISSSVFFVEFEQIKVCWETVFYLVSIFSSNLFQANTPKQILVFKNESINETTFRRSCELILGYFYDVYFEQILSINLMFSLLSSMTQSVNTCWKANKKSKLLCWSVQSKQ